VNWGVKFNRKSVAGLIPLVLCSTFLTLYAQAAYHVATFVGADDGWLVWISGPGGPFFPWPKEPGNFAAFTRTHGAIDYFIYVYLIRSWALAVVVAVLWIVTVAYVSKLLWARARNSKRQ
jgi:hypothetical protein